MEDVGVVEGHAERLDQRSCEHRQPEGGKESLGNLGIVEDRPDAYHEKKRIGREGDHA